MSDNVIVACVCGKRYSFDAKLVGHTRICPACNTLMVIAAEAPPEPEPPPELPPEDSSPPTLAQQLLQNRAARVEGVGEEVAGDPRNDGPPLFSSPAPPGPRSASPVASPTEPAVSPPHVHHHASATPSASTAPPRQAPPPRQPPVPPAPPKSAQPLPPHRPFLEVLLDPRNIQWLLTIGGALMVLGLIIWLASLGVFRDPGVLAAAMGLGTLAIIFTGWFITLRTRYRVAGQALTFLACLIAPLNLWFYHAQGLMTVQGHLWVAAVGCCVLYAATAILLRDALFVYALEGGVTLTALLLMAEMDIARRLPLLAVALAAMGVISIHVERAFLPGEGPFARKRFGMAFFWCGQAQLGLGLIALLAAQVLQWLKLDATQFFGYTWASPSAGFPFVETALWLLAVYTCIYADVVVRRVGVYTVLAAVALLMAEVTALSRQFNRPEFFILALALTGLVANAARFLARDIGPRIERAILALGALMGGLALLVGLQLHIRATSLYIAQTGQWHYNTGRTFVAVMLAAAIASRISAYLCRKENPVWAALQYFFYTGGALLMAAAGGLRLLGIEDWPMQSTLLMVVPIGYLIASIAWRGHSPSRPLLWVAHGATAIMFLHVLGGSFSDEHLFVRGSVINLWYGGFFAAATLFYAIDAGYGRRSMSVYMAAAMGCGAVWQFLAYPDIVEAYYVVVFAVLGLVLLIAHRLLSKGWGAMPTGGLAQASGYCAHAVLSIAFVAAVLQGLTRLAANHVEWPDLGAVGLTLLVSLLAIPLVPNAPERRWYVVTSIGLAAVGFMMINFLSALTAWQKLEAFCVVVGVGMLTAGYIGRLREDTDQPNDLVTAGLWIGSVLAAAPLLIAVLAHRFGPQHEISLFDELGLLTVTLLMVLTGYIWQFKATTLVGGVGLVLDLLMIVIFAGMKEQLALGVYLAVGGALVFGVGLALAISRERLLKLPGEFSRKEGVWRVFAWR